MTTVSLLVLFYEPRSGGAVYALEEVGTTVSKVGGGSRHVDILKVGERHDDLCEVAARYIYLFSEAWERQPPDRSETGVSPTLRATTPTQAQRPESQTEKQVNDTAQVIIQTRPPPLSRPAFIPASATHGSEPPVRYGSDF